MTYAKIQHYVPRSLLRAFEATPQSEQVHVFDKAAGRSFFTNVRNVGGEKAFYDLVVGDVVLSFEPALGQLETSAAEVLSQVRDRTEIGFLSKDEHRTLAQFVVVQYFRTRQFRENVEELGRLLHDALATEDAEAPARLGLHMPTEEEVRLQALRHLERSLGFAPLIESKEWILYEAPTECRFWISDHPVVMNNEMNRSDVQGTIGFAVPGIEIYLPISPTLCLGFLCPTIRELFIEAHERSASAKNAGLAAPQHDAIGATRDGFEFGFPVTLQPENIDYINSLGVLWAERFLFANHANFGMVERMIAENPRVRVGPRPSLA